MGTLNSSTYCHSDLQRSDRVWGGSPRPAAAECGRSRSWSPSSKATSPRPSLAQSCPEFRAGWKYTENITPSLSPSFIIYSPNSRADGEKGVEFGLVDELVQHGRNDLRSHSDALIGWVADWSMRSVTTQNWNEQDRWDCVESNDENEQDLLKSLWMAGFTSRVMRKCRKWIFKRVKFKCLEKILNFEWKSTRSRAGEVEDLNERAFAGKSNSAKEGVASTDIREWRLLWFFFQGKKTSESRIFQDFKIFCPQIMHWTQVW